MVEETITGTLEDASIHIPEIPIERITSVLPEWRVLIHSDVYTQIQSVDHKKSIISSTEKIKVGCIDECGANKQNLEDIRTAILEVAKFSKKSDMPSQLKEKPSVNTLTYKSIPTKANDASVSHALDVFRKDPRVKRVIFQVDELFYGFFSNNQNKVTTVTYRGSLDDFLEKYQNTISKIFKFPDLEGSDRKTTYIS